MAAASMSKNLRHGAPPSSYQHKQIANDQGDEIIGYVDPWILSPGDVAHVKISSTKPELRYQLVRLLPCIELEHAPKPKKEVITTVPSGTVKGRPQRAHPGSYALIDAWADRPIAGKADGLEISFYVQPWILDAGHRQALLSTLDVEARAGLCIFISKLGGLEVWVGTGDGVAKHEFAVGIRKQRWAHVRLVILKQCLTISVRHLRDNLEPAPPVIECAQNLGAPAQLWSASPLLLAATMAQNDSSPAPRPSHFFNGRLDSPTFKAVGEREWTIASYNFARDISSDSIVDASGNGLDGILVNSPARAVKGQDFGWDLLGVPWMHANHGYGAIHFHDDDLDDAGWETDLEIGLPSELRSGAYAVEVWAPEDTKLKDHIVFFVGPKAVRPQAKVAFVFPTFTYLAYANERMYDETKATHMSFPEGVQLVASANFERMVRRDDLGLSHYDVHSDGSTVLYSTSKRPILNVRPDYIHWGFQRPREFASDLLMVGLLEELLGDGYDILTDHHLHLHGAHALASYDLVITGSHPEYPSMESLNAYEHFSKMGKYLMYMGGNGFYWRTVTDRKRPHRMECRKADVGARTVENPAGERYHSLDGGSLGGLWRSVGRPPNALFGVGSNASGKGRGQPFRPTPEALEDPAFAWVWQGLESGSRECFGREGLGGCASGDEIDRMDLDIGTPANAVLLAQSLPHDDHFMLFNEELVFPMIGTLGSQSKLVRSDMTYFDTASGGAVFSVGSINWNNSMGWDGYSNDTAQITRNVIGEFLRRADAKR